MTVVALDLDSIVNIEAEVFPGKELLDQFPADLLFPEWVQGVLQNHY